MLSVGGWVSVITISRRHESNESDDFEKETSKFNSNEEFIFDSEKVFALLI